MSHILNVLQRPVIDNTIIRKEFHSYLSYLPSYENNDEIRISIQNQDLYVLPSESFLYIEGIITKNDNTLIDDLITLHSNCMAYLFSEIRYELNGIEIDRTRYVGKTTDLKNILSFQNNNMKYKNAGWSTNEDLKVKKGHFNFCLPLNLLLGFAEDYNKIILNGKHELILLREKDNKNVYKSSEAKARMKILNIVWKMPHIQLADSYKLQMLKVINKQTPLLISFRSWDMYYNPILPETTSCIWNVKLAAETERPRFIILAFQTNNVYNHCNLSDIKVYLNSDVYPYDNLNQKFDINKFALFYEMYLNFQQSYYGVESHPLLTPQLFKDQAPFFVINVSHQNETVKSGPIDIRIDLKTIENIPPNTSAYCLIIHDKLFEYTPLTNEVRKLF